MRLQQCFFLFLIFMLSLLFVTGQRPARRKFHGKNCPPQKRCLPLHSRVPFP